MRAIISCLAIFIIRPAPAQSLFGGALATSGGSSFIISTVTTLGLRLNANDPVGRTLSGSSVTQLTDLTGNGRHFTPGVAPTIATGVINGKDWVYFNYANKEYLTNASYKPINASGTATHIWVSIKTKSLDPSNPRFCMIPAAGSERTEMGFNSGSGYGPFFLIGDSACDSKVSTVGYDIHTTAHVAHLYHNGGTLHVRSNWKFYWDGVEQTLSAPGTSFGATGNFIIGGYPGLDFASYDGWIKDVIVNEGDLSAVTISNIDAYLRSETGSP